MSEHENPLTADNINQNGTPDDAANNDDGEKIVVRSETGTPPAPSDSDASPSQPKNGSNEDDDDMKPRLERLGGEPAPDITPEEFARLQQSGQIHIDPRGRVRSARNTEADAGVSLRKRRAWYRECL
ncbi:MAG TPA: hypothetical protein VJZ27_01015 [Aggregatilineales bacterium]|nr:hypothetical protein [Aggregatilineales bacterium]